MIVQEIWLVLDLNALILVWEFVVILQFVKSQIILLLAHVHQEHKEILSLNVDLIKSVCSKI